ncbi:uncharacterized protein LOC111714208 isoform X3 [Eurytemora carolleeae]|nr:uncharacterized protein LOC111714208 isoform X3 [Eurytemora carolleeae]XP_023345036.1 uncharacterized protein LOC111714208 isoform X3 [Eurytemora carolleeae]|eukprot:XP_023345035.1 uncharacterized protein LOC111714208 isoform X3 [Eurytemora affinis]
MALAFLIPSLFSNLSAGVIRLYRNSVPFAKMNIIFIINYYIVEMFNLFISLIALSGMWVSIICKLPLFLGTMVMKSLHWVALNMIGLNIVQAALRMLLVLKFDQMMELEPEQAAKQLFLAVQLIYIPTTIIITVIDLQTGFISPYLGYLLGSRASNGHDIAWYTTDVNAMLALTGTVFAYTFNTLYLKRKHALIIRREIAPPQQNLISLKKLMVGALALALLALAVFVIQTLVSPCNRQTTQPLLVCCIVVGIQLFYSKNESAWNHFKQVLRVKRDNLEFSTFNSRQMFGRGNRISLVA